MAVAISSSVLEPIIHSARLIEYVDELNAIVEQEAARRERFYEEMTDAEKVEFIEGEVVMHSPARRAHLMVRSNIEYLLRTYVSRNGLGEVHGEKCLCVFPRNDYEPDVVFFGKDKVTSLDANTMKFPIPDLVVEVLSESTERRDRGIKFEDFEAHGVGEYWIVDADHAVVEQYVRRGTQFELVMKSNSGHLESKVIAGLRVLVVAFFQDKANREEVDRIADEARSLK